MKLDLYRHECYDDGKLVHLAPAEFQVLVTLVKNIDRVISRQDLQISALGKKKVGRRLIDAYVSLVRKKIPKLKDRIESIYSVGYRMRSAQRIVDEKGMFRRSHMIDIKVIEELERLPSDDGGNLLEQFAEMFFENYPKSVEKMRRLLAESQISLLSKEAHTIKSNCGSIGALDLFDLARRVEELARSNDISEIAGLLDRMRDQYIPVKEELSRIVNGLR
jgi:HPt (histidine-containing phosphotransfer) domain-containing protein